MFKKEELAQLLAVFEGQPEAKVQASGRWIMVVAGLIYRIHDELDRLPQEPIPVVPDATPETPIKGK